jgi:predicted acylesterase/phospholipase RssA
MRCRHLPSRRISNGRWLFDGALVNNSRLDYSRALARYVIAVNLAPIRSAAPVVAHMEAHRARTSQPDRNRRPVRISRNGRAMKKLLQRQFWSHDNGPASRA